MTTPIQQNLLSKFHDGEHCHFTKYEYINETLNVVKKNRKPCILISGNSDYVHTQEMINGVANNLPYVKKWYTQNLEAKHKIAEAIPLGITNISECARGEKHGVKRVDTKHVEKIDFMYDDGTIPHKDIYANFNINTNTQQRIPIAKKCQKIKHISSHFGLNLTLNEYFRHCRDHKMTVCPGGNGPDTHRFWETLYINRVPITLKTSAMSHFEALPAIFLDNWNQLNDLDFLVSEYNRVKNNPVEISDINYWINKISNLIKSIS